MHPTSSSSAESRAQSINNYRHQPRHPRPINVKTSPHSSRSACHSQGRVLDEEDLEAESVGQFDNLGDRDQDAWRLQDNVFQSQLMTTLWFIYCHLSQAGRSHTLPSLTFESSSKTQLPHNTCSPDSSSQVAHEVNDNSTPSQALVPLEYDNLSCASLLPCPSPQDAPRYPPMADSSQRRDNARAPGNGMESMINAFTQHPTFQAGSMYGHQVVEDNGVMHQGNVMGDKPQGTYRSHLFASTTVSGGTCFLGDMPESLAREIEQNRQNAAAAPGRISGQQSTSQPANQYSSVQSFAKYGNGNRLG